MRRTHATVSSIAFAVVVAIAALLAGSDDAGPGPERHAWITGLKPEMAARYRELHAKPWPSVNRMLKECNIRNFSIWQREIDGKLYLFAYLEYTGRDFDADMQKMAADPETRRWWRETDPCQLPLPDAAAKGKVWSDLSEVYYLP
jgi:L-rhamnose mutarotase